MEQFENFKIEPFILNKGRLIKFNTNSNISTFDKWIQFVYGMKKDIVAIQLNPCNLAMRHIFVVINSNVILE
jgi:hypothetical protein